MNHLSDFLKDQEEHRGIRLIRNSWIINIEITNSCSVKCSNCTRASKHINKPFFSSLEFIEQALNSLKDWPRGIGIIGGEPQDHPQWASIYQILKKFNHKGGYALFTSRELNPKYRDLFKDYIYTTNHNIKNLHHPLLLTLEDVVPDPKIRRELIERCWLQRLWSPSITPKGGFWCEIAGVLDMLWDGPGGYNLDPGWWRRDSYEDQIQQNCKNCGICIPMPIQTDKEPFEIVTTKYYNLLKKIQSPFLNNCKIYSEKLSRSTIKYRQEKMMNLCYINQRTQEIKGDLYF